MENIIRRNFSEENVQRIINVICEKLNIPSMTIFPYTIEEAKKEKAVAMYKEKYKGFKYIALLLDESDIIVALHELGHHVQNCMYRDDYVWDTVHGHTFTKSLNIIKRTIVKTFGKSSFPQDASILRRSNHHSTKCDVVYNKN